jgi:hypothetical protein
MIKISHEVPMCLLEWSKNKMDYQYALVHLLEENDKYKEHFIQCRNEKIPIYLDNSLHEKGYAIGGNTLIKWINILKPECVFIPDVWENKDASVVNAKEWASIELPEEVMKVAVVQATNIHEAMICCQIYKDLGYKKIAFSYGASYYNDVIPHPNKDLGKALGRVCVISTLYNKGILTPSDKVHLLGCASPFEFSLYKNIQCIESIDTSNPVMLSIDNIMYNNSLTNNKPKSNMNDCFYNEIETIDTDLLKYNIEKFKQFTI